MAVEEGITMKLWKKFHKETFFGMYTPVVVFLASDILESKNLEQFLCEDDRLRLAFTVAYERAENCTDAEEDKIKLRNLKRSVENSFKIRSRVPLVKVLFLLNCHSALPFLRPPGNAIHKYIRFLRATAWGKVGKEFGGIIATPFEKTKVAAYTLGAMAPWKHFYSFISNEIQPIQAVLDPDYSSKSYKQWIDIYFSQEFGESTLLADDMLDKLSVSLTREELEVVDNLYHHAMELVVEFFSTQSSTQDTIVPFSMVHDPATHRLSIFSDFDVRCSPGTDSTAILPQIAILAQNAISTIPVADSNGSETELPLMEWDYTLKNYFYEYEQCIERIMPGERVEFNYEVICDALQQLSDFVKRENSGMVESAILEYFDLEDIEKIGRCFILQDDFKEFFQKIAQTENLKTDFHILSCGWFGDFIRSTFSSGDLNNFNIHANELVYEQSRCTGEIVWKMESPVEKLQVFNDILKESNTDRGNLTVYIGATVADLLCLLNADIGIVIDSSPSLRKLGERYGISFEPLFSGVVRKQKELAEGRFCCTRLSGNLYTVSCWAEIHAFILGSSYSFISRS